MSWKEIMMAVNSDVTIPLNSLINDLSEEEVTLLNNIVSKLDNTTYGLSAIKTILSTVNTNAAKLNNATYGLSALKSILDKPNVSAWFEDGNNTLVSNIMEYSSTGISISTTDVACGKFFAPLSGTVQVHVTGQGYSGSGLVFLKKGYYVEGINTNNIGLRKEYIETANPVNFLYNSTRNYIFTLNVEQGTEYTIYLATNSSNTTALVYSIDVYANIATLQP